MDQPQVITTEIRIKPSRPQFDIINSRQQVNLFLAGQGSGKSHSAGIVAALFIKLCPKVHGFIGANTYGQLSDSTLHRIRKVWREYFDWTEWTKDNPRGVYIVDKKPPSHFNTTDHEYDSYRGKICFQWGTVVYKGSLDNAQAHEGKEFAWAILDETKDTKESAVKEVITGRLRESGMYYNSKGKLMNQDDINRYFDDLNAAPEKFEPFTPLYIFTSPAKVPWINEWFSLDDYSRDIVEVIYSDKTYFNKNVGNKKAVISSTYHNSHNLPANFIENQKSNLPVHLQGMLIYANPFTSSGGEFYKCFDRTKHVRNVRLIKVFHDGINKEISFDDTLSKRPYCPDISLHISFDFNLHPYITLTIYQIVGKKIYQINEICLGNPRNRTEEVCKEFIRQYRGHESGLSIYGDPAGRQEDTKTEKGFNNYTIIMRALNDFKPILKVPDAPPSVEMRGQFINKILESGYAGIELIVDEHCNKSISDLNYLKEAAEGTKLKEKTKDEVSGIPYEKYGHTSDSLDYILCRAFSSEYAKYKAGRTGSVDDKPGYTSTGRTRPTKNSY